MRVTITKLWQGVRFRVVPENKPSKLSKLHRQKVLAPHGELEQANRDLLHEMEAEWEKDWSEL